MQHTSCFCEHRQKFFDPDFFVQGWKQNSKDADHMSLSDVVLKDSKARTASGMRPSDALKAASGADPGSWAKDPWKHMQRKDIPTRYDNQLQEVLQDPENDEGSAEDGKKPQTAKQAATARLKGQKVDAGSVRSSELAGGEARLSTGADDRNPGAQQAAKSSAKLRDADEDADEELEGQLSRSQGSLGSSGSASRLQKARISSDSRKTSRDRDAGESSRMGSREDGEAQSRQSSRADRYQDSQAKEDAADSTMRRVDSKSKGRSVDILSISEAEEKESESRDGGAQAGRGGRHGQRPGTSADRADASSGGRQAGRAEGSADLDADLEADADEEQPQRGASKDSARTRTNPASDKTSSSSSSSTGSAASKRGSAESDSVRKGGSSSGKKKAAPAVRPALKGYKLSWDVLEDGQELSAEALSDDPTRWIWSPSVPKQSGGVALSIWHDTPQLMHVYALHARRMAGHTHGVNSFSNGNAVIGSPH